MELFVGFTMDLPNKNGDFHGIYPGVRLRSLQRWLRHAGTDSGQISEDVPGGADQREPKGRAMFGAIFG